MASRLEHYIARFKDLVGGAQNYQMSAGAKSTDGFYIREDAKECLHELPDAMNQAIQLLLDLDQSNRELMADLTATEQELVWAEEKLEAKHLELKAVRQDHWGVCFG